MALHVLSYNAINFPLSQSHYRKQYNENVKNNRIRFASQNIPISGYNKVIRYVQCREQNSKTLRNTAVL
jgi:hypothetical protein